MKDKTSSETRACYKSNIRIDEGKGIILNRLKGGVTTRKIGWKGADVLKKVMFRVVHDKFDKK